MLFPSDLVRSWDIRGNGNVVINLEGVKPKAAATLSRLDKAMLQQYDSDKLNFNFHTEDLGGGWTRYYKTIDGILTNDFYDIRTDEAGESVEISRSPQIINEEDVSNLPHMRFNTIEFDPSNYVQLEENAQITIQDESGGLLCKDICINLSTGETVKKSL